MTLSRRRKVGACTALAVVTVASLVSAPPLVAQTTTGSPVRLSGDAVGGVRLGTSQARAIGELATMFGHLKTTKLKANGWCGLTAQSTRRDVLFNFGRGRLVGYELGDAYGKTAGQPNVVTVAGLRLGDTIAQAEKILRAGGHYVGCSGWVMDGKDPYWGDVRAPGEPTYDGQRRPDRHDRCRGLRLRGDGTLSRR